MNKNTIYSLIGIAIIIGGGLLAIHTLFGSFNPFYVVVSGSMIPTINIGDIVIIKNNSFDTSFNKLKVGDIIVFRAPEAKTEDGKPKVIVHRVAEIGKFFQKEVIRTRGDANPYSIPGIDYPLFTENYVGKVVYVVPKIGTISMIITPPINYIIMAIIIGLLIYSIRPKKIKPDNETT
ncbi:MAG TPA: signal peptidase I [Nitrososphaeraceae archaeon]|nr:signal peptidase I [Nitrososphaeraceae archaeon]